MNIKKPMLADKIKDTSTLRYPLFASPKLDGIRALTINGVLVSRNLKPIPNNYIRDTLAKGLPDGLDGELILANGSEAGATFSETSSAVMRKDGKPNVLYHVFDYVKDLNEEALMRTVKLGKLIASELPPMQKTFVRLVVQRAMANEKELLAYEQLCLQDGYEGVMVRDPKSPYKEGRSSLREGYLLKLKRFADSEAKILGFEEQMHNANEAEKDLTGHTKRSQAKDGMVPMGTLGKVYVKDIHNGVEFEIGTGFDASMRQTIWDSKSKYMGKIVKYKYQECGMKDKPRFPVFLGFRDERDL